ncbi:DUF6377 domain-containing protein [Pontibacter harenae]|uniref:DUF6377 domain-containing protein n=1 Tax=Pontibacter harenae TaxID=2894083 RepID=UPI001E4D5BCD|nr:DUF6377 domain-containing protein [Pontibacter harenae]MCC9166873.1 DUF6377 domain-containing protein [Pontibacter harenae]
MAQSESLLDELTQTIGNKDVYVEARQDRIEQLKQRLVNSGAKSPLEKYNVYNQLYNEYSAFQFDSAFTYALKLQETAWQLDDPTRKAYAKLKTVLTLLSSGMYKETFDSLSTVNLENMPDSIRVEYYMLKFRAYHDLASFNSNVHYSDRYLNVGINALDSALAYSSKNTLQYYYLRGHLYYLKGMKGPREGNLERAEKDFKLIIDKLNPSYHEYAKSASLLSSIYNLNGETDKAIDWMARAATADVKAAVKEGVALMTLAEFLYHNEEESRAYEYIKQALEDANFYGAKQRKLYVSTILPIIEGERLATVEQQRSSLFTYAIVVTILTVLVLAFAFIIFRQIRLLKAAKRTVTEANQTLNETNHSLIEANRIKEEYVGYSFSLYSGYLNKIDRLKKSIDTKLMARKYDEIGHVMKSINLKKERENLYEGFDKVFLRLFPNFVATFNSFFKEEDKFVLKDQDSLNTELRIFALIRIGIHDHEQIANILEYSVSTIYNYKTRVKNRSILPNDEFEKKVMEIQAF